MSEFGDLDRCDHYGSRKTLCEYMAAEAIVAWKFGTQVRDVSLRDESLRYMEGGNCYAKLYEQMASVAWQLVTHGNKWWDGMNLPTMFYPQAHVLIEKHPLPNKGDSGELARKCWRDTMKFLSTDEAIEAVKALAVKIEDAREMKGLEVEDVISAHFIESAPTQ